MPTEPNGDRAGLCPGVGDEILMVFHGRAFGTIITLALSRSSAPRKIFGRVEAEIGEDRRRDGQRGRIARML